jgi:hypothetical protein
MSEAKATFMADSRVPWGVGALSGAVTEPGWKTKPRLYLIATEDKMIPPPDGSARRRDRRGSRWQPRDLGLEAGGCGRARCQGCEEREYRNSSALKRGKSGASHYHKTGGAFS